MPILQDASAQDKKRLMQLFPVSQLREGWPQFTGTKKDEIGFAIAGGATADQIAKFIADHIGTCRQHVYIFNLLKEGTTLPTTLEKAERIYGDVQRALYLARVTYVVLLRDPAEETTLEFLWPIQMEIHGGKTLIVRFVGLEKDATAYFDRPSYVAQRDVDEGSVLRSLMEILGPPLDIHKGIKTLWEKGFMDSPRSKYKKPMSMASETMDEERGIREYNPELYLILQDSTLLSTLFYISESAKCGATAFTAECTQGYLTFPRYSEKGGTDDVIKRVLENN